MEVKSRQILHNEFFGEIARFCEDEKKIYFFDEITGGLFYMDKDTYEVELLISPDVFVSSGNFSVLQLIKFDDNLYIIPSNMKYGWKIFNLVSGHLQVVFPFEKDEIIGNATKIKSMIYIIPEQTDQIFAKYDMATGIAEVISDHWFDGAEMEECWGLSAYADEIVFPIIGTKEIVCFKDEKIEKIRLLLREGVTSVCLDNDGLWILPESGDYLYIDDRKNGVSKINIAKEGTSAGDYIRIVSVESYIVLLPRTDGNMLIYKKNKKRWVCVENREEDRFRVLFRQIGNKAIPFWGYSFYEKKILFMPLGYRLGEVNLETEKIEFRIMNCGKGFMGEQYEEWARKNARANGSSQTFQEGVFGCCLSDLIKYV